ncbi:MBL fold metallo-hydrolase [Nitratiruptor sp. SB155-2]|uniref:MBL fold metallo-hydrolase n=1 Tax=Nitratiruptor sp. (strain SB155-2) TaxID=387092 RepID=UPI00030EDBDF|nr:MBL fold metallo-hydrolase [Nitratiruptor sp. SB155-2]
MDRPIEIAPRVWWVGYVIPNDPFQCHVYLIENGDESILIDPGSKITWEVTRKKIESIISLENIKYIVAHHQDPDIVASVEDLLDEIGIEGRFVVTHWHTKMLLQHYNWGIEFYDVDKMIGN